MSLATLVKTASQLLILMMHGAFLARLPAYVRNEYPMELKYATGRIRISRYLFEQLHEDMLSYSSATELTKSTHQRKTKAYEEEVKDYLSRPVIHGTYMKGRSFQRMVHTLLPPSKHDYLSHG
jgi:hypothetical protein